MNVRGTEREREEMGVEGGQSGLVYFRNGCRCRAISRAPVTGLWIAAGARTRSGGHERTASILGLLSIVLMLKIQILKRIIIFLRIFMLLAGQSDNIFCLICRFSAKYKNIFSL